MPLPDVLAVNVGGNGEVLTLGMAAAAYRFTARSSSTQSRARKPSQSRPS
jgi:hypothetical protein